jgi:stress response protein YsnF
MALYRVSELNSGDQNSFDNLPVKNFEVISDRNERVGRVFDALLDQDRHLRYLVIELGTWATGKLVLLPIGLSDVDPQRQSIYARGLSRELVAALPAYHTNRAMDYTQEEQVRRIYRSHLAAIPPLDPSAMPPSYGTTSQPTPMASSGVSQTSNPPLIPAPSTPTPGIASAPYTAETYTYQQDADLYGVNEQSHQPFLQYQEQLRIQNQSNSPYVSGSSNIVEEETIPLKEERLMVDRHRRKTGEVIVRKEIETEIIEVPVQREKLIVEQVGDRPRKLAEIDLAEGEIDNPEIPPEKRVELPNLPKPNSP